ncbi:MAG: DUF2934 domain-containing protein [Candidatus Omnitrophota bacterium]|nr:DUF2934 domain-containing protein [Candidatus Omnitrophota bacterium]
MAFGKSTKNTTGKSAPRSVEGKISQMIRDRAYYIWESKGKPKGQDLPIWIQAEKEIRAKSK